MKNRFGILMLCMAVALPAFSQKKEDERLTNSGEVLKQLSNEGLSQAILAKSLCVTVFPGVKKLAIGIGGSYGRGAMVCRKGETMAGAWSAPVMYSLDQGSLGVQLGGSETDFVFTVMTKQGVDQMLNGKMKLGSGAQVAAGPVGAQAAAFSSEADILTYSRSKGAFAGVSLAGATVEPDKDANKNLYGKEMVPTDIINTATVPASAKPMVDWLNQTAPGKPRG